MSSNRIPKSPAFHANLLACGIVLAGFCVCGCSPSPVSELRSTTAEEAARMAIDLNDKDQNKKLDTVEIAAVPALAAARERLDTNGDQSLDMEELQARFKQHDSMSQIVAFAIDVKSGKTPLVGAVVTLTPEPFMGEGKQSYKGTVSDRGQCFVVGEKVSLPGVPTGFYRVHIVDSAKAIDVTLGCEVADDLPTANRLVFDVAKGLLASH